MIKTFTFELPSILVTIDIPEGLSDKEIQALAENEVVKQISKKFPKGYRYGVTEGTVISDADVIPGRPVKMKDSGTIGIIYEVKPSQKYPIKVVLENGQLQGCTKAALESVSKRTKIEKLITGRQDWEKTLGWLTGKTAYFVNAGKIIPVVINEVRNGKEKSDNCRARSHW
ncbi:hypothetical protein [Bacillus sp. S3]|uniref:hypothetical protein n=1 Tax=Bacillus sp. S3 TaxID=486398 RepID=UPI00168189B2|nr:hypothetical protein [Bacillus sp. S3]